MTRCGVLLAATRRAAFHASGLALAFGGWACAGKARVPDIESLDELTNEYDSPTATLDQASVRNALAGMPDLERLVAGFRSAQSVVDGVDDGKQPAEQRGGEGLRLRGSIHVTLRCPGELGEPVYDDARNGKVALTMAVSDNQIQRTIRGQAGGCMLRGQLGSVPVSVRLDGPFAFDLGEAVGLKTGWSREHWLMLISGSITVGDYTLQGVSARVVDQGLEHLLRLPDGSTVVISLTDTSISVRDGERSWSCSKEGGPCAAL